ncbi:MAG: MCE family protein [Mycobacterium sp.]
MKRNVIAAAWRFAVFAAVCLVGGFALLSIFAQFRFGQETPYRARFTNISGLTTGDFVRIAGVEVGKVKKITFEPDATLTVDFGTEKSVVLTEGSRAIIRYDNLIGDRYLALEDGAGGTKTLAAGGTIPLDRTQPALDLDALIGGFRPLFRALSPEQVNDLSGQLISAFQGQGPTITSFLARTSSVTNTLADRDQLIGSVITNLNTVLATIDNQSGQFDKAVTSLSQLVDGLAQRRSEISTAVAYTNAASRTFVDLLSQARPPLQQIVQENDRASGSILLDHEYFDDLLGALPEKYKVLGRQGLYGDYFSFYQCDLGLKINGKGGQPMYIKIAGQPTGRCQPK